MKSAIKPKTVTQSLLMTLALFCFVLLPKAQAVSPPPDGGYPGGNTAEGQNALLSRTTGGFNTAVGWFSLKSLTGGSYNTAVGAGALDLNNANENTAVGTGALLLNTTGPNNTTVGAFALINNTDGGGNTAIGDRALQDNTGGNANTATGAFALQSNTTGPSNTAMGFQALFSNTTNGGSTATGYQALFNDTGFGNTANGYQALLDNTTGTVNTAVGSLALSGNAGGSNNIALGALAGSNVTTADSVICIGSLGQNVSNSCYIGQIFTTTSAGGVPVFINSDDKLGTISSSRRFKEEIKPMERASEALFALKPVTFRYKKELDPEGTSQLGLVAEDVEKVNPGLVVRDKEGKPYTVRYDQVNAMLLNEFLKEHRTVKEQGATIAELKKEIAGLATTVREQAAQIQKVNAQVEASSPVARMVLNSP